jgi:putative oxidoreductase
MKLAERLEIPAYAALRIVAGAAFSFHGMQKLFGIYSMMHVNVGSQMWFGAIIELVGGLLIAFGLFTRCAAFVCSGEMAVAYLQFHWKLHFADGQWIPAVNRGELAVVYCFLFLFSFAHGPGPISLDERRKR